MVCYIEGCDGKVTAYGLCKKHYRRIKKYGVPDSLVKPRGTVEERFWPKVAIQDPDNCWLWIGAKSGKGYGFIGSGGRDGKMVLAHRMSYQMFHGPIPRGSMILHECDNPSCVNPRHLRHGTGSENIQEAFDKGRKIAPSFLGKDHPRSKLTEEQVRFIKSNPDLGHKEIADMFGLSPNCIRGVRIGRTWRHIDVTPL